MRSPLLSLVALVVCVAAPSTAAKELRIVAATNDLGAIARAVVGEAATIDVVARPDRDLHVLEVRPSTMRKTARADFYLQLGLSADLWSQEIVRGSRNRSVDVIDCSAAIEPLEVPAGKIDASMGDVHPEGNPHYWLDPRNDVAIAHFLAAEFGRADPATADQYSAAAQDFAVQMERRLPAWRAALEGREFIEYHSAWIYLAARFDMHIVDQIEPLPGIPPSARHLAELAQVVRERQVPIVVRDVFHSPSGPEFLRRETGVRVEVLPTSCTAPTPDALFALFDEVARVLGDS